MYFLGFENRELVYIYNFNKINARVRIGQRKRTIKVAVGKAKQRIDTVLLGFSINIKAFQRH